MHAIRMNHPAKNALGPDLVAWLADELDAAGDAPLLLTGTADAFCAGLDLKAVAEADEATLAALLERMDELCARLFEHPAPTAAAVNGHAIAGGCILAQCCDRRVATEAPRARLGVNELALGAPFPPRMLRVLRHRLPAESLHEVLLGAGLYDPAGALRVGLVDALAGDPEAEATAWLERTARHPRATYAHVKRILNDGVARPSPAELARFRGEELALWTSAEVRERVRAALAR